MAFRRLQFRFMVAGLLLLLMTLACGAWSVAALMHIRSVADRALQAANDPTVVLLREETIRAAWVIAGICAAAVGLWTLIGLYLTRKVVGPVELLTRFADSIRFGDFSRRVEVSTSDELGRLASGLNRMADALAELQRFNLAQLLESKWMLEAALEALPDPMVVIDSQRQIVSMNRTARLAFAGNGKEGTPSLDDLQLPESVLQFIGEALRGLRPQIHRADLKGVIQAMIEGEPVKLLPLVVPIRGEAEAHGAILTLYDVSEFAKLNELRMELISVASHELKNPLTTLQMNVLMLRDTAATLSERQKQMVDSAIEGCADLGKTIDELLDLTRADAGTLRLTLERVDLGMMLEQAVKPFGERFADAGVQLAMQKEIDHAPCRGDAARLNMVMANLLANALKYTPSGGRVTAHLSSMQNAGLQYGPTLKIAVTDTGPGIPPEFRERVFEKFFRVEHHRTTQGQELRGTGIGLYLCKHIVEAHGGNIWAEVGDGGTGTTIAFTLPGENQS